MIMLEKPYTIIYVDHDKNTMTIRIDSRIVNELERVQDEYTRKVGDCSIILTNRNKSIHDDEFKMEFETVKKKYSLWQDMKDRIRDECVIPAIVEAFGYDATITDSAWLINFDRSCKCIVSDIHMIYRKLVHCEESGYVDAIKSVKDADLNGACIAAIYDDIGDRGLKTPGNYDRIEKLAELRTTYSMEKAERQDEFFKDHVTKVLEGLGYTDYSNLTWECGYYTGHLKIFENVTDNCVTCNK